MCVKESVDVTVKWNGKYHHLLKVFIQGNEIFVHTMTRNRDSIKAFRGEEIITKSLIDHISYHKDGTIHAKFKDGSYETFPAKLKDNLVDINSRLNVPILAITYYASAFPRDDFFITYDEKPENHVIFDTNNVTFTVIIYMKDESRIPKKSRHLDVKWFFGGCTPDKVPHIEEEIFPISNFCLNPDEEFIKSLHLFSKEEQDRCEECKKVLNLPM